MLTKSSLQEPQSTAGQADGHPLASDMPSTTLYVKNLAFATNDTSLFRHFDSAVAAAGGTVRSALVQVRFGLLSSHNVPTHATLCTGQHLSPEP